MKHVLNEPLTKKRTVLAILVLCALALLSWGGWNLYVRLSGRPPSVAQTKRAIWKHLAKQARGKKFIPPPGSAEAVFLGSNPVTTTATNKAGRVRTTTRSSRTSNSDVPESTLSEYFRTNQAASASYDLMYRYVGEELKAADILLDNKNPAGHLVALSLASEASIYARTNAMDLWLSARICEAYLWPSLILVAGTNRAPFSQDAILNLCELAYRDAGETNNMIRAYETIMAKGQRAQSVDMARFRLALIYIDFGRNAEALALLKSIKTIKTAKIDREIGMLEILLANKKK